MFILKIRKEKLEICVIKKMNSNIIKLYLECHVKDMSVS